MTFPLATKSWVGAEIQREIIRILDEYFQGNEESRSAAVKLRGDLDLLVLLCQHLEERGQSLENLTKELKLYSHENVHDMRNLIMLLQGTVNQIREILQPPEKVINTITMGEIPEEPR